MAAKKSQYRIEQNLSTKQADVLQDKLRAVIIATTAHIDRKDMNKVMLSRLRKFRKQLMDANNYFGWSVRTWTSDKPSNKVIK